MTFKRRVLSALGKAELLALGRALELEVKAAMTVDELRDVLAGSKRARLERLVTAELDRDTLKAICEACGLDLKGKEKQPLVDRILAAGGGGRAHGDDEEEEGERADATVPVQSGLGLPAIDPAALDAAKSSQASTPRAPRKRATGGGEADDATVVSYRHGDRRKNNPEVGMVDPDTDPQQPKTTWKYDPHIDPALQFDIGRAQVENLIDAALASGDEAATRRVRDLRYAPQHPAYRAAGSRQPDPRARRCMAHGGLPRHDHGHARPARALARSFGPAAPILLLPARGDRDPDLVGRGPSRASPGDLRAG